MRMSHWSSDVCSSDLAPASELRQAPLRGVRVPASAIAQREGRDVAFVMAGDDEVEMREIEVGRNLGDDRQVTSGLSAGEDVVLDPPAALEDGGSEERRVGKECVSTCRSRGSAFH